MFYYPYRCQKCILIVADGFIVPCVIGYNIYLAMSLRACTGLKILCPITSFVLLFLLCIGFCSTSIVTHSVDMAFSFMHLSTVVFKPYSYFTVLCPVYTAWGLEAFVLAASVRLSQCLVFMPECKYAYGAQTNVT